jgi:hypothetical protein
VQARRGVYTERNECAPRNDIIVSLFLRGAAGCCLGEIAAAQDNGHLQVGAGDLFPGQRAMLDAFGDEEGGCRIEDERLAVIAVFDFAAEVLWVFSVVPDVYHDFIVVVDMFRDMGVGIGHIVYPAELDIGVAAGDEGVTHVGLGGYLPAGSF